MFFGDSNSGTRSTAREEGRKGEEEEGRVSVPRSALYEDVLPCAL